MKKLKVTWLIGFLLSICATIYMATNYYTFSANRNAIDALAPGKDIMTDKIDVLLGSSDNKEIVIKELKFRHDKNETIHRLLSDLNTSSKNQAGYFAIIWLGMTLIFGVLLFKAESLRE